MSFLLKISFLLLSPNYVQVGAPAPTCSLRGDEAPVVTGADSRGVQLNAPTCGWFLLPKRTAPYGLRVLAMVFSKIYTILNYSYGKSEMKTRKDLLDILRDNTKWPSFDSPGFLNELNVLADDCFSKGTIEGYLASMLIYHQLCEELLKVLIMISHFYLQCTVFPMQIRDKKLDKLTFGQLITEYERCVQSEGSDDLINKCNQLNQIRINMVHRITLKTSLSAISQETRRTKTLFDDIWVLFDRIYDGFKAALSDCRDDMESFEELLNDSEATT